MQNEDELWYVPLVYATQEDPDFTKLQPKIWMDKDTSEVTLQVEVDQWIILNTDARSKKKLFV